MVLEVLRERGIPANDIWGKENMEQQEPNQDNFFSTDRAATEKPTSQESSTVEADSKKQRKINGGAIALIVIIAIAVYFSFVSDFNQKPQQEYRLAAEQGDAMAQTNLGWMYDNGEGVPEDDTEAVKWYRKAAEQGYAMAQHNLGWMYANGEGVPEDKALGCAIRRSVLYLKALG